MKSHYGDKEYKCFVEGCTKSFYDRGNLKYHQKKAHPEVSNEYPHICNHSKCNMRFKTMDEKMKHHFETEPYCEAELGKLSYLLNKIKENILKHASPQEKEAVDKLCDESSLNNNDESDSLSESVLD
jgi:hypothetical protein